MSRSNSESIINLLETPLQNPQNTPVLVKVVGGDTVSQIITKYYDTQLGSKTYQLALAQLKRHNPKITNANQIRVGQVLKLMPMPSFHEIKQVELPHQFDPLQVSVANRPFNSYVCTPSDYLDLDALSIHMPNTAAELEAFHQASWFEENWFTLASSFAGSSSSSISLLTGSHNTRLMLDVKTAYEAMNANQISRNAYNYKRRVSLQALSNKLGSTEKIFFNGKTAQEAVRISRVKGVPATDHIVRNAARFNKISKIAGSGGSVVLAGASLAYACHQIGATQDQQKQNEIMVETVGSIAVGYTAGLVALALVTGPVGIGVALMIGGATTGAGWAGGKLFKSVYSASGSKVDLAGLSGVRGLCR